MSRALLLLAALLLPSVAHAQAAGGTLSSTGVTTRTGGNAGGDYCGTTLAYGGGQLFGGGPDDSWIDTDICRIVMATSPDVTSVIDACGRYDAANQDTFEQFSQSGAAALKPHLSTLNGRRALDFDGSDDYLQSARLSPHHDYLHRGTTDYTMFLVVYPDESNPGDLQWILCTNAGTGFKDGMSLYLDDRVVVPNDRATIWGISKNGGPHPWWILDCGDTTYTEQATNVFRVELEPGATGDDLQIYAEGTQIVTSEPAAAYPAVNHSDPARIGSTDGSANFFNGKFAALLIFKRFLDATDEAGLQQVLEERFTP